MMLNSNNAGTSCRGTSLKQTSMDLQNMFVLSEILIISINDIIINDCTFTDNDIVTVFELTKPTHAALKIIFSNSVAITIGVF